MPTKEFALELISSPLTPKSHILISPMVFTRMFDGFTSEGFTMLRYTVKIASGVGNILWIIFINYLSNCFSLKLSRFREPVNPFKLN